jgi:hypothetical protein
VLLVINISFAKIIFTSTKKIQMALFKLLFLFSLVVVYRREWLEKQLARHVRSLKRVLGPWWPLRDGVLSGATPASVVDLTWANQVGGINGGGGGGGGGTDGAGGVMGTVHNARVTDKMLHEQGQTNKTRAAAAAATAAEASSGRGLGGGASSGGVGFHSRYVCSRSRSRNTI